MASLLGGAGVVEQALALSVEVTPTIRLQSIGEYAE
jgi:hypothetical protein